MREIGGYIELDRYSLPMLHEKGIKLNSGRNALAYIIKAKKIKKILMPKFMCNSCEKVLSENNVTVKYFSIGLDFKPVITKRASDEWVYIVNYYGQLSNKYLEQIGERLIVDNAQAYFQEPIMHADTLYTCRKFFGVPDGAILYTDKKIGEELDIDISYGRMHFLLGRYEKNASEFYAEYIENNRNFNGMPLKKMSLLTENLLHAIDYDDVKKKRTENFEYLHERLNRKNALRLFVPKGAFMYPFYVEDGMKIRKLFQQRKIYIPMLWPRVCEICNKSELEYKMAQNILPLPCDQRYGIEDMEYICRFIDKL